MEYKPTIGLEIHAGLNTGTKMFCDSLNDPDETEPNKNVCPVCLGHPGTLPVINREAIEKVIKTGLALGGEIAKESKFDRKNYFYPDLPKGYQISQYDMPLVSGGELLGVRLTRIHLEEDAGTLSHDTKGASLVDFNRAGVPLMELVTEADIYDAETAVRFAKELQLIFRYLGVSGASMEKGEMRIEVNISVSKDKKALGTKVEVKNINSFKAVEGAIEYETKRQTALLEKGLEITQETRGWDESSQKTISQRSKEEAEDYRYFPEPDLPPFDISAFDLDAIYGSIPELPRAKRARFVEEFGLSDDDASLLVENPNMASFYENAESELARRERDENEGKEGREKARRLLFNYITSDLVGLMKQNNIDFNDLKITPEHFAHLVDLIADKEITSRQAKDILPKMISSGADPSEIIKDEGLGTIGDEDELLTAIRSVISENEPAVVDYRAGKIASLKFLLGQSMKKLRGRADPIKLEELIKKELS